MFAQAAWQLVLTWGLLIGLGTGSMALVFAATVANAWFVKRRGLVMGILTAGGAAGQLIFLPVVAFVAEATDWRIASLLIAGAALAVLPLAAILLRDRPADVGLAPYGADAPDADSGNSPRSARRGWPSARSGRPHAPGRSGRWPAPSRSAGPRPTA